MQMVGAKIIYQKTICDAQYKTGHARTGLAIIALIGVLLRRDLAF
jgi:hypothetical protein